MIVALGELALFILVKPSPRPHREPGPGSVTMSGGGSAANFAVWVSRLGQNTRFIGKVGTDSAAELLEIDLLKEGVLPELVRAAGSTATLTRIMGNAGEHALYPDRGVAPKLTPDEVAPEWLADATWLHLPATALYELPIAGAAAKAVRLARKAGARVSIDLASAAGLHAYGLAKFSLLLKTIRPQVLFANQQQAMLFKGGALGELCEIAVLKMGAGGCASSDGGGFHEYPAERVHVVDAIGAGDAFDAAWCATYIRTGDVTQACRRANKLAAQVIRLPGLRPPLSPARPAG
ncbi:MAG: carbohydrate kinase family protein [Chloroflexota bacterium]